MCRCQAVSNRGTPYWCRLTEWVVEQRMPAQTEHPAAGTVIHTRRVFVSHSGCVVLARQKP